MVSALDRKLLRDLARMKAQILAIALVMSCGVATIIIAMGSYRSLAETRTIFYQEQRFATLFAGLGRAPRSLLDTIAALPGVSGVEGRIVRPVMIDMAGMREPASGLVVSVPNSGEASVNALYLRSGRMPSAEREGEVAVIQSFADAHDLRPGSTFSALINGRMRKLVVTAVVLSPEYVYAIGPGDMVPDQRRFGVLFMSERILAGIFDMSGSFNSLAMTTLRGSDLASLTDRIDPLLAQYGGTGAYGRDEQVSHAYLDNELVQLSAMARIIPPIFLFVSAFLVNMILSRLIALEREQIGLMKALGYSSFAISIHYAKLTLVMALTGSAIGAAAGIWGGRAMTELYARFFYFPFLVFHQSLDLHAIAIGTSVLSALLGAIRAIAAVIGLAPAVAMQPPAPVAYRSLTGPMHRLEHLVPVKLRMILRTMLRRPLRTALTTVGTSLSVALLVTALFSFDSIDFMMDTVFGRAERQDATIAFSSDRPTDVEALIRHLPGVMRSEPFRAINVILRNGHRDKRLQIISADPRDDLALTLDADLEPLKPTRAGLMISEQVASRLALRTGDLVEVELIDSGHVTRQAPVTAIVRSFVGLTVIMNRTSLDRLVGDGPRISGTRVAVDPARLDDFYASVKTMPAIAGLALQTLSRQRFRDTIGDNITTVTGVYVTLALIITFGVIYNSARIRLSEQGRDLASLRVLGFSRSEVSALLLGELAIIVLAAQPLGWLMGTLFSWWVTLGFESDLFRIPFVINRATYGWASLLVIAAALASALIVRRRIDQFDLVAVLKTRE